VRKLIQKYQVFIKHLFNWFISILLIQTAGLFPHFIETVYAQNIYPVIAVINRWLAHFIPFSLGDLIYFWGISYLLYQIIQLFIHIKKPWKQLAVISNFLLKTIWIFYLSWGLNYFRLPLSEIIRLKENTYTMEQLQAVTDSLISRTNRLQMQLTGNDTIAVSVPYALERILDKAPEGYQAIADMIHTDYSVPCVKTSLFSKQISYMHVSGYLNPFTGEAQINKFYPKVFLPDIASHEIAHQLGFAPENEANFLGYLASIHNSDTYFNYAGNIDALYYLLIEIKKADKEIFTSFVKKINKGVLKNFKEANEFSKRYRFPIDFSTGYDAYLKINKQASGIRSYNEMVRLVIAYELQLKK
jgi:hypothetical protein